MASTEPAWRKPRPQAGQTWEVAAGILDLVERGPVYVLDIGRERVVFTDRRGVVGSLPVPFFAGLYDPPEAGEERTS